MHENAARSAGNTYRGSDRSKMRQVEKSGTIISKKTEQKEATQKDQRQKGKESIRKSPMKASKDRFDWKGKKNDQKHPQLRDHFKGTGRASTGKGGETYL